MLLLDCPAPDTSLMAVFDGHGGDRAAQWAKQEVPALVEEHVAPAGSSGEWGKVCGWARLMNRLMGRWVCGWAGVLVCLAMDPMKRLDTAGLVMLVLVIAALTALARHVC